MLVFLRDGPWGLIRTFLAIHSNGSHVRTRSRVRRWPFTELVLSSAANEHLVTLSGERYHAHGPLTMRVVPGALRLLYSTQRE